MKKGSSNRTSLSDGDLEGRLLYWEARKICQRDIIRRDVKMSCKRVSLSIGALLGNLKGIHLPLLFERKG